jgi:hypothetical protein
MTKRMKAKTKRRRRRRKAKQQTKIERINIFDGKRHHIWILYGKVYVDGRYQMDNPKLNIAFYMQGKEDLMVVGKPK